MQYIEDGGFVAADIAGFDVLEHIQAMPFEIPLRHHGGGQRGRRRIGHGFALEVAQGMDAADSYQPGVPAVLPDVQALAEVVARSGFAQTASSSNGAGAGVFLAEPGASWHGAFSTANNCSKLSK